MDSTSNLFRVIPESDLNAAVQTGLVPRCASDERNDCVHLNLRRDVETVANAYFSPEEKPVVLEIKRSDIHENLVFGSPVPGKPWEQLAVHQPNIPMSSVVAVHRLEVVHSGARPSFRLAAAVEALGATFI